jgi:hypothetical protein
MHVDGSKTDTWWRHAPFPWGSLGAMTVAIETSSTHYKDAGTSRALPNSADDLQVIYLFTVRDGDYIILIFVT